MMNQLAFVILFLYVRSFELPKYYKHFDDGETESKPNNEELKMDELKRGRQELENLRKLEANYFLERRTFL